MYLKVTDKIELFLEIEELVPFANGSQYIAGSVKVEDGNELDFTLEVMYDGNSDSYSHDITWLDDEPENKDIIEKQITKTLKIY